MSTTKPALSYRLLSFLLLILWVLHAFWQAVRHHQLNFLWQRLSLYPDKGLKQAIWIHAASVGEIELIKPLVEHLHKDHVVLVSTFTVTGFQHALRILPASVTVRAIPIDLQPLSRRFFQRYNFKLALIAETELWPETLYQARRKMIPLIQINARLSDKSLNTSGWTKALLKNTLCYFDRYLTRTEQDATNLVTMGAARNKISICGNLKYANATSNTQYEKLVERPYILFASTHDPEEKLFGQLVKQIKLKILVIIAPRHPQRANEILKTLKPLGLNIKQRSLGEIVTDETQIYLADTLGELKTFIAHAEFVIMGGSFCNIGGHNVLEPARLGKAIITGPSDANIQQDIKLLLEQNSIIQVNNTDQLADQITFLLNNSDSLKKLSTNAKNLMNSQQHILGKYVNIINQYLA